jgi:hypothetical protein
MVISRPAGARDVGCKPAAVRGYGGERRIADRSQSGAGTGNCPAAVGRLQRERCPGLRPNAASGPSGSSTALQTSAPCPGSGGRHLRRPTCLQNELGKGTARTRRRQVPGGRRGAASHSTGLFFRGGQQPADAIGVRDDVMDGGNAGEPGVCRHERLSSCRVGRGGQDRVERAKARSFLEQA